MTEINPQKTGHQEDFISTQQAADMLGISLRSVQYWVEKGKLSAWKTAGGHRRIARDSVDQLMQEQARARKTHNHEDKKTILIVEDEPSLLEYYRLHISSWELPVNLVTAENGFEGLMQIGQFAPSIIITDLIMPNMDGFTMIQAVHNKLRNSDTRIIAITVLSQEEIRQQGNLPDDVVVFHKPVPLKDLRNTIQAYLLPEHNFSSIY